MVIKESLQQFAQRLGDEVHPGDLAQRISKDGTPLDFWTLNKNNTANAKHNKGQYARIKFLSRTDAFKVKTRENIIDERCREYGELSKTDVWNEGIPALIYKIKPCSQGPEYQELVTVLKKIRAKMVVK